MISENECQAHAEVIERFVNDVKEHYVPAINDIYEADVLNVHNNRNAAPAPPFPDHALWEWKIRLQTLYDSPSVIDICNELLVCIEYGTTFFAFFFQEHRLAECLESIILKKDYRIILDYIKNKTILNARKRYLKGDENE